MQITIDEDLLRKALEHMAPCNVYNPFDKGDGSDWDKKNECCLPFHEFECDRCITKRMIELELECNESF